MSDILDILIHIFKFIGNIFLFFLPWWVWLLLLIILIIVVITYFYVIKPATD
jgi:hypothetical protein